MHDSIHFLYSSYIFYVFVILYLQGGVTEIRAETSIRWHQSIDKVGYENNKNIR